MRTGNRVGMLVLMLSLAWSGATLARDGDVVMSVVGDEEAAEEDFVDEIRLPEPAARQGRESAAQGLDRADEAREGGRDFGRDRAAEARERAAEARDRAAEARERGRAARDAAGDRDESGERGNGGRPDERPGRGD